MKTTSERKLNSSGHFCSCLLITVLLFAASCSTTREIKDPNVAFEQKRYSLSAKLFEQQYPALESEYFKAETAFKIGESYRQSNQTKKAEQWYKTAAELGYDPVAIYYYAQMLKSNQKYEEAAMAFEQWGIAEPFNRERAQREILISKKAQEWLTDRHNVKIENLEPVNSAYADFAPVIYDRFQLVFSSSRPDAAGEEIYDWTGEKYFDLFQSTIDYDGNHEPPVPFNEELNSQFNEGTIAFNGDFTVAYFTRCGSLGEENDYCNIYRSTLQPNGSWDEPEMLQFFEDSANVGTPFISKDGLRLYFSSDAEGGYGENDLYYVNKTADGWSSPVNMGSGINTAGNEMYPFLLEDETLYFASDGHAGMGGLDIFKADKKGVIWENIRNMKYPINSGADDFALIYDKTEPQDENDPVLASGYLCSTRDGGEGNDDIYRFTNQNINFFEVRGIVKRKIYADPEDPNSEVTGHEPLINAKVELFQMFKNVEKKQGQIITQEDGRFRFELDAESDYKLFASKTGYFSKSELLTTRGKKNPENPLIILYAELVLDKIFEQKEIVIPNIYYDYDKATLRPESKPVLDQLYKLIKENPNIKIEIGSHTDSRGSDEYNKELSQARAQSVVDYFIAKGVDRKRLVAKGYGESKLVNECADGVECTEEEHQKNRRTTFKVLSSAFELESYEPEDIKVDPKKK